jgi:recombination protein RecA
MSKSKKNTVDGDININETIDKSFACEQKLIKEFGENIIVDGNYIINQSNIVIPVSPSIDTITGGVPEGNFFTFTGQPKTCKTLSSLDFAATAQNPKYGGDTSPNGRDVYFYAIEGRLKNRDIVGIPHLNRDKLKIIQSIPGKILNAADYLEIAEQFINENPGSVHIIDSYSALCTEAEKTGTMADQQRADGPKIISKFCRKVCNVVPVNRCIVIGITHLMGNPTGYSEWKEKSGQSIAYQVNVKLRCIGNRPWTLTQGGVPIGQEIDWLCQATATTTPPLQKATSYVRYGYGIDKHMELLVLASDLGIVNKAGGGWYTFPMFDNQRAHGSEKARELLLNTPNGYDIIYDKIKEILG